MNKYRVFIGEKEYLIEIDGERIKINDEEAYAGIHFLNENGLFMVEKDEGKREYHIKPQDDGTYRVTTRGLQVDAMVEKDRGQGRRRGAKKEEGLISAPIPGVVMEVRVKEGETVEKDQVLVVLESMKMLMEFKAPIPGTVEKVAVSKDQKLEKGDEMVRIKKAE